LIHTIDSFKQVKMTAKERFKTTLSYKIPDRLPMDLLWPRIETLNALKTHFKTDIKEDVFRKLGIDFRWIEVPARFPQFEKKVNGILTGEASGQGELYIFHNRQTFEDQWGIIQRIGDDGKYLEWKNGPLAGKKSLSEWALPEVIYPQPEEISDKLESYREFITVSEIEFPFKLAWNLAGFNHFCMMMIVKPDFVEELYDQLYSFQTIKAVLAAKAGYDVIAVVGDVAGQTGMMFSPAMFERFDLPRLTRLIQEVKGINQNVKVLYHSDGKIDKIIPLLIRCGIDILNPIQSACMDPAEVKRRYGHQLTFHGTISVQDTIPNGTVDDVRKEVIQRIQTVGYNGGLIISPENSIPYNTPVENILTLYDTVRHFNYDELPPN